MEEPADAAGSAADAPVTMSNTKAEIVAAAEAAGFGTADDLDGYTKLQLLELWGG